MPGVMPEPSVGSTCPPVAGGKRLPLNLDPLSRQGCRWTQQPVSQCAFTSNAAGFCSPWGSCGDRGEDPRPLHHGQCHHAGVDHCAQQAHGCEQLCLNTEDSYVCQCSEGFLINDDLKTCSRESHSPATTKTDDPQPRVYTCARQSVGRGGAHAHVSGGAWERVSACAWQHGTK